MQDETKQILEIVTDMQNGMDSMQGQITSIKERMATKDDLTEGLAKLEGELRAEIRENTKAIDELSETVRGQSGYATEIDLLMSRMTVVEQSLGIKPGIPIQ